MIALTRNSLRHFLLGGFILAFTAACAAPTATPEQPPGGDGSEEVVLIEKKLVVIADRATLRSGPGVSFDNIGSLERDTVINADGQTLDGDWYRVRLSEGSAGEAWISAEFTALADEVAQGNTEEPPPPAAVDTTTPSPTAVGIATLVLVDRPTLTSTAIPATNAVTSLPTAGPPMISASIATNCRAGTSRAFEIIAILTPGDQVEVRGRSPDGLWWYIQDPGRPNRSCWVWGETTTVSGDASQIPEVRPPPTPTLTLVPPDTLTFTPTATATIVPPDTPTPSSTSAVTGQPPPMAVGTVMPPAFPGNTDFPVLPTVIINP